MSGILIDWNDPDFCKKYRYRNGEVIKSVYVVPPEFAEVMSFPCYTLSVKGCVITHRWDGLSEGNRNSNLDIVPAPREPRRGEGWMISSDCESGSFDSIMPTAYTSRPHSDYLPFRIKWEEVIE